jgi:integrase
MTSIKNWLDLVEGYLSNRRGLGFALANEASRLRKFAEHASRGEHAHLTLELAVEWARCSRVQSPITWARRIETVRGFALYLRRFDSNTEVPPAGLFGPSHRRLVPHIYTEQELIRLLEASNALTPQDGLRPATCRTIFGLLASSGLRISEAVHLRRQDFDSRSHVLRIREAKFHKERLVILHPTVAEVLQSYETLKNVLIPRPTTDHLFIFDNGKPAEARQINYALRSLCGQMGWVPRGDYKHHRLHDLRHTFIVRSVLSAYEKGIDADRAVLALSAYVGHARVADTYWYFTGIPELMNIAAERFRSYTQEARP